jgi:hypothetical protein
LDQPNPKDLALNDAQVYRIADLDLSPEFLKGCAQSGAYSSISTISASFPRGKKPTEGRVFLPNAARIFP